MGRILLTQDPIGLAGGVNLYAYAGNNPITFSDPFGLCPPCGEDIAIALGIFVANHAGAIGEALHNIGRQFSDPQFVAQNQLFLAMAPFAGGLSDEFEGESSGVGESGGESEISQEPTGAHSTFGTDQGTGKVTHYETKQLQTNPQNPNKWETVKRYDGTGKPHFNKKTGDYVPTPHVHDPTVPGGVRPAGTEEIPR